jgi:copper chaperone CopZ
MKRNERLEIEGMSCMHCVEAVKNALLAQGVNIKHVNIGSAEISYDDNEVSSENVLMAVREAGYQAKNYKI